MILEQIVKDTKTRVAAQKESVSDSEIKRLAEGGAPYPRVPFGQALRKDGIAVIAEVKKASPSKGVIADRFDYLQIAADYEAAGAAAISVLTEPLHFLGDGAYLTAIKARCGIPVLRKDFIIDAYQLYESVLLGADAVLLIAAILSREEIAAFRRITAGYAIDCLVEVHDRAEAQKAVAAGADIIGVNNRNLADFSVDFANTTRLIDALPAAVTVVSESGVRTNADIRLLRQTRVDAVLIGETLMRAPDKRAKLKELTQ